MTNLNQDLAEVLNGTKFMKYVEKLKGQDFETLEDFVDMRDRDWELLVNNNVLSLKCMKHIQSLLAEAQGLSSATNNLSQPPSYEPIIQPIQPYEDISAIQPIQPLQMNQPMEPLPAYEPILPTSPQTSTSSSGDIPDIMNVDYNIEEVRIGGEHIVALGSDKFTGKKVALKLYRDASYMRELDMLGKLRSEYVVDLYNFKDYIDAGCKFLVLERGNGTLQEILEKGRMEPEDVRALAIKIMKAVRYIHSRGVVHGDLKPKNIMLCGMMKPVFIDFDGSRDINGLEELPEEVTLSYCDPCRLKGQKTPRASVDVWSIGLVIYQMLTGCVPGSGMTNEEMENHLKAADDDQDWFYEFGVDFGRISNESAKRLLQSLLVVDSKKRGSIDQALSCSYLSEGSIDTVHKINYDAFQKSLNLAEETRDLTEDLQDDVMGMDMKLDSQHARTVKSDACRTAVPMYSPVTNNLAPKKDKPADYHEPLSYEPPLTTPTPKPYQFTEAQPQQPIVKEVKEEKKGFGAKLRDAFSSKSKAEPADKTKMEGYSGADKTLANKFIALIDKMEKNSHDAKHQEIAAKEMWDILINSVRSRAIAGEVGCCEACVKIFHNHHQNDGTMSRICGVFRAMGSDATARKVLEKQGVLDMMLELMVTHATKVEVVKNALAAIWNITLVETAKAEAIDKGAINVIKEAFKQFPTNVETQQNCCGVIRSLAVHSVNQKRRLARLEVVSFINTAMDNLPKSHGVQLQAVSALANLAHDCPDNLPGICNSGVLPRIIRAIDTITPKGDFPRNAFMVLKFLAKDADNRRMMMQEHCVEHVVQSLNNHPTNINLQSEGCASLWNMSLSVENRRVMVTELGVLDVVKNAMVNNSTSAPVIHMCCGVLRSLALDADNRVDFTAQGFVELILKSLEGLALEDQPVASHGIAALWNMMLLDSNKKKVGDLGGCQALKKVMEQYPNDKEVQMNCCGAFRTLAKTADMRGTVAELGIHLLVIKAMRRFKMEDCDKLYDQGCAVMWNIGLTSEDMKQKMVDDDCMTYIHHALSNLNISAKNASGAIRCLALTAPIRRKMLELGTIKHLTGSIQRHRKEADMVEQGLAAMWNLGVLTENKPEIARLGGLERIKDAYDDHGDNTQVVQMCLGCMRAIALDDTVRAQLPGSGILGAGLKAVATHAYVVKIQEHGFAASWNCSLRNEKCKKELIDGGVLGLMCSALRNHPKVENIVKFVGGTARALATVDTIRREFPTAGIIPELLRGLENHKENVLVVEQILGSLWNSSLESTTRQPIAKGMATFRFILKYHVSNVASPDSIKFACGLLNELATNGVGVTQMQALNMKDVVQCVLDNKPGLKEAQNIMSHLK